MVASEPIPVQWAPHGGVYFGHTQFPRGLLLGALPIPYSIYKPQIHAKPDILHVYHSALCTTALYTSTIYTTTLAESAIFEELSHVAESAIFEELCRNLPLR